MDDLKMNLQMFADGAENPAADTDGTQEQTQTQAQGQGETAKQTYTADEVMKLIQSETDRRVTQALAKQQREFDKKTSLAGLGEQERAIAERDQKIADYETELGELRKFRAKNDVMTELTARGLNPSLADVIDVSPDAATNKSRLDALEKTFRAAVEAAVKSQLAGSAPRAGNTSPEGLTREQFRAMSLAEQQRLYNENPNEYNRLTKGS